MVGSSAAFLQVQGLLAVERDFLTVSLPWQPEMPLEILLLGRGNLAGTGFQEAFQAAVGTES